MKFYNSLLTSSPAINPESDFITKDDMGKYLLKLETGGIGPEIFSLINGISSIEQIIETIAKKYTKVPKEILLRDICEYLLDLRRLQVIKF